MEQTLLQWVAHYGYAGIFFLLMFGIIGLPIPDETLLILSGYLAFKGQLHIVPTIVSAFLGSVCGITLSYSIGHFGGYVLIVSTVTGSTLLRKESGEPVNGSNIADGGGFLSSISFRA